MDLDHIDLSIEGQSRAQVRASQIDVSPEESEQLGPLVALQHDLSDPQGWDLVEQVTAHLRESLHDKTDPMRCVRALVEGRACFRLLVKKGYWHGRFLQGISDTIDQIRRLLLREIIRRHLRGTVTEAQAEISIELLNNEAALGWDVAAVIDSCEAELVSAVRPA